MTSTIESSMTGLPSSSRNRVVDSVSVGVPLKKPKKTVETVVFIIHDFEHRDEKENVRLVSPTLVAHGYRWGIICIPKERYKGELHVGVYLEVRSKDDSVFATCKICCNDCEGEMLRREFSSKCSRSWGYGNFFKRSELKNYLEEDGSLIIEIDIEMDTATQRRQVWYPKKLQQQDILVDLYEDASSKTADVVFCVGTSEEYHAHKNILSLRCKKLYEIAKECDNDVPIPIDSTRGKIFKSVLDFAYTAKLPEIKDKNIAMELLIAADCYECIQLKLYVESVIVEKLITPENAAQLFLFADSYSCALLREKAINVFVTDAATVKKANAWSTIKESKAFIFELLEAATSEEIGIDDIASIREQLEEVNLELDGSREVLVERLKAFRCEEQEEEESDIEEAEDDDSDEEVESNQ